VRAEVSLDPNKLMAELAYLVGASFEHAQCQEVNFWHAQCQGVNFCLAQCQGANFWHAQCQGADFSLVLDDCL
jgi:uncharacterized protein YjbI with pentapeptide repeats